MIHHNPALMRFPDEAAIVGRMVVGFGELEVMTCRVAAKASSHPDHVLKMLYSLRSTSARVSSARLLMEPHYAAASLAAAQNITLDAVTFCLKLRNQYAHCNWTDYQSDPKAGLFFADLQDSASREDWFTHWKHIDVPLLTIQEAFFGDVRSALLFLEADLEHLRKGWPRNHGLPEPLALPQPPMHNPASQHIPPWLSEDQKAQHKARSQAAEQPASQPERPPSVPRLTEEQWEAKRAKEAREKKPPEESNS
jgi:hypothetical protein